MGLRLLEQEAPSVIIPLQKRSSTRYKSSEDVERVLQLIALFGHKVDEEAADIFRKKIPNEEVEETRNLILATSQSFEFEEGIFLGSVNEGGEKFGFGPCSLTNVLDFLLQIEHPGCSKLPIITDRLEMRHGAYPKRYSLLFQEGADGKFQLSRVKYNPEYYLHPSQMMLFRVLE